MWYFTLNPNSIHNWDGFEKVFLEKFGEDKNHAKLVLKLSKIMVDPKEKVK